MLPVDPWHTALAPAMLQLGVGLIITSLVHELVHPSLVILSVKVKLVPLPAVTVTLDPVELPTIVAVPALTDQLWLTNPPEGEIAEVYVLDVDPAHTAEAPEIIQPGVG